MESFTYFAYGSNMLTERLKSRCPGAIATGIGRIPRYRLSFAKKSTDKSGKATIAKTDNDDDVVYGVLFRIPTRDRAALDEAEGTDYRRDDGFPVIQADGHAIDASAYLAKSHSLDEALRPYDWYRDLILEGANEHGLPDDYQLLIAGVEVSPDPLPTRKTRLQALAALNRNWEAKLGERDRIILRVARNLYLALPAEGACYRATFFLGYHLKKEFGIEGTCEVGFVNDGTDDLFSSHAWHISDDRITDIAISRPLNPRVQRPGPIFILGREFGPGWPWSYHLERSAAGQNIIDELAINPDTADEIGAAEELHRIMVATSKSHDRIRAYLDAAPDSLTYSVLAKRVESGGNRQ